VTIGRDKVMRCNIIIIITVDESAGGWWGPGGLYGILPRRSRACVRVVWRGSCRVSDDALCKQVASTASVLITTSKTCTNSELYASLETCNDQLASYATILDGLLRYACDDDGGAAL